MPYFKNKDINLLFIHIPKTGGTSVEKYLSKKYSILLDLNSIYCKNINNLKKFINNNDIKINSSAQHLTYNTIFTLKDKFNVNFSDSTLKIITIVRNPYNRIISDLFWYKKININSTTIEVYNIIKNYIKLNNLDNHNIPQYLFLIDAIGKINNNIVIFKTENLNNYMINYGFKDFNLNEHKNSINNINYIDYLNKDSIELINDFYENDFIYFDYDKL